MVGGLALHAGENWDTPGLVVSVPEDGKLSQARFVIFARNSANDPENSLANIYGYPMEFHVWTDGIQGGTDSFSQNPQGLAVAGHIQFDVKPKASFL